MAVQGLLAWGSRRAAQVTGELEGRPSRAVGRGFRAQGWDFGPKVTYMDTVQSENDLFAAGESSNSRRLPPLST